MGDTDQYYNDRLCTDTITQKTIDRIYDIPLNKTVYSKEQDGTCLRVTKEGTEPNFIQKLVVLELM